MIAAAAEPRGMPEIRELARLATCGQCWAHPGEPCAVPPGAGQGSHHLARYDRACRRGLISGADMAAVLTSAGPLLSPASVVYVTAIIRTAIPGQAGDATTEGKRP